MSVLEPRVRGKPLPRWSVVRLPGLLPASRAGLPDPGRCVWVGPPLLVSGPRRGSAAAPKRLPPRSVKLAAPALLKMMQFFAVTAAPLKPGGPPVVDVLVLL